MLRLEVPAAAKHTVELGPAPRGLHGVPAHPPHQPHHYQHRCRQPLRTHTATATAASSTEACSRSDGPRGRTWPHVQHYIGRGVYHSGCDRQRFIVPKRSRRAAPSKWTLGLSTGRLQARDVLLRRRVGSRCVSQRSSRPLCLFGYHHSRSCKFRAALTLLPLVARSGLGRPVQGDGWAGGDRRAHRRGVRAHQVR